MKRLLMIVALALPLAALAEKRYLVQDRPFAERIEAAKRIVEQIHEDPTVILRLDLTYPPPEEVKRNGPYQLSASAELLAVMASAGDPDAKYTEEILLKFLDRLDWEEVDAIAFALIEREALSPEARRKLAPRVERLLGKAKVHHIITFYKHPKTPRDVVESALANPNADELMRELLNDRLKLYPAE